MGPALLHASAACIGIMLYRFMDAIAGSAAVCHRVECFSSGTSVALCVTDGKTLCAALGTDRTGRLVASDARLFG